MSDLSKESLKKAIETIGKFKEDMKKEFDNMSGFDKEFLNITFPFLKSDEFSKDIMKRFRNEQIKSWLSGLTEEERASE